MSNLNSNVTKQRNKRARKVLATPFLDQGCASVDTKLGACLRKTAARVERTDTRVANKAAKLRHKRANNPDSDRSSDYSSRGESDASLDSEPFAPVARERPKQPTDTTNPDNRFMQTTSTAGEFMSIQEWTRSLLLQDQDGRFSRCGSLLGSFLCHVQTTAEHSVFEYFRKNQNRLRRVYRCVDIRVASYRRIVDFECCTQPMHSNDIRKPSLTPVPCRAKRSCYPTFLSALEVPSMLTVPCRSDVGVPQAPAQEKVNKARPSAMCGCQSRTAPSLPPCTTTSWTAWLSPLSSATPRSSSR